MYGGGGGGGRGALYPDWTLPRRYGSTDSFDDYLSGRMKERARHRALLKQATWFVKEYAVGEETVQHAMWCSTLATRCNALHHTATRCTALQCAVKKESSVCKETRDITCKDAL